MVGLIRWIGVENDADEDDDSDADDEDMASPTGVSSVSAPVQLQKLSPASAGRLSRWFQFRD